MDGSTKHDELKDYVLNGNVLNVSNTLRAFCFYHYNECDEVPDQEDPGTASINEVDPETARFFNLYQYSFIATVFAGGILVAREFARCIMRKALL